MAADGSDFDIDPQQGNLGQTTSDTSITLGVSARISDNVTLGAAFGDELADPHQDDRAGGQGRDLGQGLEARQVERTGQDVLRCQQGQHAVRLQDRHRDRQVAGVLVDLVAPELTLAAERLEGRHDAGHQLHDDRRVDVRVHPQRHDREVR